MKKCDEDEQAIEDLMRIQKISREEAIELLGDIDTSIELVLDIVLKEKESKND